MVLDFMGILSRQSSFHHWIYPQDNIPVGSYSAILDFFAVGQQQSLEYPQQE